MVVPQQQKTGVNLDHVNQVRKGWGRRKTPPAYTASRGRENLGLLRSALTRPDGKRDYGTVTVAGVVGIGPSLTVESSIVILENVPDVNTSAWPGGQLKFPGPGSETVMVPVVFPLLTGKGPPPETGPFTVSLFVALG